MGQRRLTCWLKVLFQSVILAESSIKEMYGVLGLLLRVQPVVGVLLCMLARNISATIILKPKYSRLSRPIAKSILKVVTQTFNSHVKYLGEGGNTMRSNFVAKNAHKANRAAVHRDRKQQQKRGYVKHKRSQT